MARRSPISLVPVLTLILTLLVAAGSVAACDSNPGLGPFVVVGRVMDESGKPVEGLSLILVPVTSGTGEPDIENGVYRVPERDDYQTRTNDDGLFIMPGVYDYWETETHRFQVLHADPTRFPDRNPFVYLEGGLVDLTDIEAGMVKTSLTAKPAGGIRVELNDAAGRPYAGTRALLIEARGQTMVYTAGFTQGVHGRPSLPPGPVRVGVLDGDLAYFLQGEAHQRGKTLSDYLLVQDGRRLEAVVEVAAGRWTTVRLQLP